MSNSIYIQEPPTAGKIVLKTTVGDIDIELWAKECPKACRNFVQLCLEGYYNGTEFFRVVKEFLAQGGDPSNDGTGGESVYGHPFKDEYHSRLRYTRRGLVGMANAGNDENTSQFFFTFAATPELQNKNTLFGKVTGDTIYNMLKLEEGPVDHNERPMYTHRIIGAEVLTNPFNDIVPRSLVKPDIKVKKKQKKGVKNFGLLSFGEEAEDDELESNTYVRENIGKAKSLHDVTDDPKLSKVPIAVTSIAKNEEDEYLSDIATNTNTKNYSEIIKRKLAKPRLEARAKSVDSDSEDVLMTREQEQSLKVSEEKIKIRAQITSLKKQYQMDKIEMDKKFTAGDSSNYSNIKGSEMKDVKNNHYIEDFIQSKEKYSAKTKVQDLKGQVREDFTLNLLSKFRSKLNNFKHKPNEDETLDQEAQNVDSGVIEKEICGDEWLSHTLRFDNLAQEVLARDASTKNDDWYDAYDPRNPLNKRKRAENKNVSKNSKFVK